MSIAASTPRKAPTGSGELPRTPALETRDHPWLRNAVMTAAGGAVFAATAHLVDMQMYSAPVALVGGGAAVGIGALGYRKQLRDLEVDRACEQLSAMLSMSEPSRAVLTASRWDPKGWPGAPQRLVVHYPSAAVLSDDFEESVGSIVSGQTWGKFVKVKHDRRRCRIVYRIDRRPGAVSSDKEDAAARARRTLLTLLGPTGKILEVEHGEDGGVRGIEATHKIGDKLVASGYRTRVERTVSALLPGGRWRARWDLETDWVRLEIRPELDSLIYHRPPVIAAGFDPKKDYEKVEFRFGVDEDGSVAAWRPAVDPMMMITGSTGTGKTSATHTLLLEIVAYGWPVWILDGKAVEFLGFQDCPNVQIVAATIERQVALIHRAHQVMEQRYAAIAAGQAHETDFDPLVVFIDEASSFFGNLQDWYSQIKRKGDPAKPPVQALIADIARKGRLCRVHVVLALQRPDQQYLGGDLRDNFRCRVSFGRLSPQGSNMMWDSFTAGVAVPKIRGRGITLDADDAPREIQGYYTPDPRKNLSEGEEEVLAALWPKESKHARLVIRDPEPPEVDLDDPKAEQEEPGYRECAGAPWGLASEYPDLDPVVVRNRAMERPGPARTMSPIEILGLAGPALRDEHLKTSRDKTDSRPSNSEVSESSGKSQSNTGRGVDALMAAARQETTPAAHLMLVPDPDDSAEGNEDWEGYGAPSAVAPMDVHVGDLVLDDSTQRWGVIDSEPDLDPFDETEDSISITYRGDDDGVLVVPSSGQVMCRRPIEFDGDERS